MKRKAKKDIRRILLAIISILIIGLVASFELELPGVDYYLLLAFCITVLIVLLVLLETSRS